MTGGTEVRNNGTEVQKKHNYTPELALRICEEIAGGATLLKLCERDDMPTRQSVYKWLTLHQKFFDAYARAKELSGMSLEEEALVMARTLAGPNDFTSVKVQAYNIAMQQLRWSAAHRDRRNYGSDSVGATTVVPITINTTLNLGQDGLPATDNQRSIYTIEANVVPQGKAEYGSTEQAMGQDIDTPTLDLTAEHASLKDGGKGGRPVGSHRGVKGRRKSQRAIALTATKYAEQERKRLAKLQKG